MVEEKSVAMNPNDHTSGEKPIRVRRGRVDSVDLYEIKDNELNLLEKGSPTDLYLNFAIFLLSIAFSAMAVLFTTKDYRYPIAETVFVVILVVGLLVGALLLILWKRGKGDVAATISDIRKRIPPEVAQVMDAAQDDAAPDPADNES